MPPQQAPPEVLVEISSSDSFRLFSSCLPWLCSLFVVANAVLETWQATYSSWLSPLCDQVQVADAEVSLVAEAEASQAAERRVRGEANK
jgi:hypothetical protein